MTPSDLGPTELWDVAEEQIEVWQEERAARERAKWKALGY